MERLRNIPRNRLIGVIIGVAVVVAAIVVPIVVLGGDDDDSDYTLTILHNNDGESQLVANVEGGFPGIARFIYQLKQEQDRADDDSDGVITLTSGDNFLASRELNVSLSGDTFYDAVALSGVYDAMALGNHDFDFGPDVTARFINAFNPGIPFLSANLDFSNEAVLANLPSSRLAASTVIRKGGRNIGVIGAVTESLPSISSPRQVGVNDVMEAVQREAASLTSQGVNIIILVSHLQDVDEDLDLIPSLSNVDVVIAGGGDELLRNDSDSCLIEQEEQLRAAGEEVDPPAFDQYPQVREDSTGQNVLVVTGPGGYRCYGRLNVAFDDAGIATSYNGQSIGVSLSGPQDQAVLDSAENPLNSAVSGLARQVVGNSEVNLDGQRSSVRTIDTNLGSILADSFLWAGQRAAESGFDVSAPDVAITNGGGIRNDAIIAAGGVTVADTFDVAPFGNSVVIKSVSRQTLKDIMETGLGGLPDTSGAFAQIGGFTVVYDVNATARGIDRDADCAVSNPGERVRTLTLNDGTVIVENGNVVAGPDVVLATNDFLGRGGDCYPLESAGFTRIGLTYQESLEQYIRDGLNGRITAEDYPAGGTGRITQQ